MSEQVYWVLEAAVKPGQLDAFKALMEEMVATTEATEPGAINYEWSINAEGTLVHIYERYADSAATLTHLGNFGKKFAARFMDVVEIKRFTFYGAPSEDVVAALTKSGARQMLPWGGFTR